MSYFAPYIDASGIHMPTYEDRLSELCSSYRSVFGQEAELSPAVPDYQLLSVFAKALDDTSALVVSAYNSRNPACASGQALDLLLPQYGLARETGETDASARNRLRRALLSRGVFTLDAMDAAIRAVPGVTHVKIRENDTDDAVDGIPAHTVAALVASGSAGAIAQAIFQTKPPGVGTAGTLSRQVTDEDGVSHTIRFSRPTQLAIYYRIELKAYDGFDETAVTNALRSCLFTYTNTTLDIGESILLPRLYGMLYQAAGEYASTFAITGLSVSGAFGVETEKLVPEWNQKYTLNRSSDVTVAVN